MASSTTKGGGGSGSTTTLQAPSNALHTQTWMAAMQGVSTQLQQSQCGGHSVGSASGGGSVERAVASATSVGVDSPAATAATAAAASPAATPSALAPALTPLPPPPARFPAAFARVNNNGGGGAHAAFMPAPRRLAVPPLPLPFSQPTVPPQPYTDFGGGMTMGMGGRGAARMANGGANGGYGQQQDTLGMKPPGAAPPAPTPATTGPAPAAAGKAAAAATAAKKAAWYKSSVFLQFIAVVAVFLLSFVLLVAIRPPFTYSKPKDKLATPKFNAGKAALFSLLAAVVATILMVVVDVVTKRSSSTSRVASTTKAQ